MPVAKGQWVHAGSPFDERMIPVRIAATREEMEQIVAFTILYYEQIAVCWYSVSDDFNITYKTELDSNRFMRPDASGFDQTDDNKLAKPNQLTASRLRGKCGEWKERLTRITQDDGRRSCPSIRAAVWSKASSQSSRSPWRFGSCRLRNMTRRSVFQKLEPFRRDLGLENVELN